MKRWVPLLISAVILCAFTPQLSHAASNTAGIHLSWNDCGSFGAANKNFACNVNTGTNLLRISFVAPGGIDSLLGGTCVVDFVTDQATLPLWWQQQAGGCRTGLSASFDFTSAVNCADPWQGQGAGGINEKVNDGVQITDPRRGRYLIVVAVAPNVAIAPDSTLEYNFAQIAIGNAKTTGTGSCAGCSFPACIRLNQVQLAQPAAGGIPRDLVFTSPPPSGGSQQVTWQGGTAVDCNIVPVRNRTWGQIKSLYR